MKTYVQPGNVVTLTAPAGGVVSGVPVKIGAGIFAIPTNTVAQTLKFSGVVAGVVDVPKVAAEPWTEGMLVWWNTGSSLATSVSTSTMRIGVAVEGRANPSATGRVLLVPGVPT